MRLLLALFFFSLSLAANSCQGACGSAIQIGGTIACWCNAECMIPGSEKTCCSDFARVCPNEYNATTYRTPNHNSCPSSCQSPDSHVILAPTLMRDYDKSNRSCAGNCGAVMRSSKSKKVICYCDSGCLLTNDCCDDFLSQCETDPCVVCLLLTPPAPAQSCRGLCGQLGQGCSCETACVETQSCCADFQSVCPTWVDKALVAPPQAPQAGSCFGQCDQRSGSCWCDYACVANQDCCADYALTCGTRFDGVKTLGAGSCYQKCGGAGLDCWCDGICENSGDCCHDYVAHCNK